MLSIISLEIKQVKKLQIEGVQRIPNGIYEKQNNPIYFSELLCQKIQRKFLKVSRETEDYLQNNKYH